MTNLKQKHKIISIFRPFDRLEELEKIPRIKGYVEIDYFETAKELCKKDGGHLATMEELTNIVSELYNTEIKPFEDYSCLKIDEEKLKEIGLFEVYKKNKSLYLWSGTQYVSDKNDAWRLYLYADKVYYGDCVRGYSDRYAISIGK